MAADAPIVGVVMRDEQDLQIGLLQRLEVKRRFAAARAAYLGWVAQQRKQQRLMTMAVTRDQQASRAFAAELTAPLAYIRGNLRKGVMSAEKLFELAGTLNVGADVVRKQALNNGLQVASF